MSEQIKTEETWVNVSEGAELSGYNRSYVQRLARNNWNMPESERLIKVRKRSSGYDIWLPDLIKYAADYGLGPYPKKEES